MKRLKLRASWWPTGKDLQTFKLVKFFSLTSFVVILVFTVILTLFLTTRAQRLALKKSEDYSTLLASNLNHQVFQLFLLPTAIEKQGRITIADPEQYKRLDAVVRNTIHGLHVEQLNIYDQVGVLSYSTSKSLPLGKDCYEDPGVKKALFGDYYFDLPGHNPLWSLLWYGSNSQGHRLK